jgi:hypothetical protein
MPFGRKSKKQKQEEEEARVRAEEEQRLAAQQAAREAQRKKAEAELKAKADEEIRQAKLKAKASAKVAAAVTSLIVPSLVILIDDAEKCIEEAILVRIEEEKKKIAEAARKLKLQRAHEASIANSVDLANASKYLANVTYINKRIVQAMGDVDMNPLEPEIQDGKRFKNPRAQKIERGIVMMQKEPVFRMVPVVAELYAKRQGILDKVAEGPQKEKRLENIDEEIETELHFREVVSSHQEYADKCRRLLIDANGIQSWRAEDWDEVIAQPIWQQRMSWLPRGPIKHAFFQLTNLTELDLSGQQLGGTNSTGGAREKAYMESRRNTFGTDAILLLAAYIQRSTVMRRIKLEECGLEELEIGVLVAALLPNKSVTALSLRNNPLQATGLMQLSRLLPPRSLFRSRETSTEIEHTHGFESAMMHEHFETGTTLELVKPRPSHFFAEKNGKGSSSDDALTLTNAAELKGKVVLVERVESEMSTAAPFEDREHTRGHVLNQEKVRQCVEAGALAIVMSNSDRERPRRVFGFYAPSPIPYLMVGCEDGWNLRHNAEEPFEDRLKRWDKAKEDAEERKQWEVKHEQDRKVRKRAGRVPTPEEKARDKKQMEAHKAACKEYEDGLIELDKMTPTPLSYANISNRTLTSLDISECMLSGTYGLQRMRTKWYPDWNSLHIYTSMICRAPCFTRLTLSGIALPVQMLCRSGGDACGVGRSSKTIEAYPAPLDVFEEGKVNIDEEPQSFRRPVLFEAGVNASNSELEPADDIAALALAAKKRNSRRRRSKGRSSSGGETKEGSRPKTPAATKLDRIAREKELNLPGSHYYDPYRKYLETDFNNGGGSEVGVGRGETVQWSVEGEDGYEDEGNEKKEEDQRDGEGKEGKEEAKEAARKAREGVSGLAPFTPVTLFSDPTTAPPIELVSGTIRSIFDGRTLTALDVSRCWLRIEDMVALGKLIEDHRSMTALDLSYNDIGPTDDTAQDTSGMQAIGKILTTNRTITQLNLRRCSVRSKGMRHLADGLSDNYTLTHLDLYENEITGVGARHLARALTANKRTGLLHLEMRGKSNFIPDDDGGGALAEAMKTTLNLCWFNGMTIEGAEEVDLSHYYSAAGMKVFELAFIMRRLQRISYLHNTLRSLDLTRNLIKPQFAKKIKAICADKDVDVHF